VFCKYCGQKVVPADAPEEYQVVDEPAAEKETYEPSEPQKHNLVFSIVGLALAVVVPLAGLIMSIIGKKKAKANADGQPLKGKNKIADILSTVGIPVSIVNMVIWAIAIAWVVFWCVIAAILAAGGAAREMGHSVQAVFQAVANLIH
jgi:hypothetical protein